MLKYVRVGSILKIKNLCESFWTAQSEKLARVLSEDVHTGTGGFWFLLDWCFRCVLYIPAYTEHQCFTPYSYLWLVIFDIMYLIHYYYFVLFQLWQRSEWFATELPFVGTVIVHMAFSSKVICPRFQCCVPLKKKVFFIL